jgi:hypothetical protein
VVGITKINYPPPSPAPSPAQAALLTEMRNEGIEVNPNLSLRFNISDDQLRNLRANISASFKE